MTPQQQAEQEIWLRQRYTILQIGSLVELRDSLLLQAMRQSIEMEVGREKALSLLMEARATTTVIKRLDPNYKDKGEE
jgi:hypothetical protein